MSLRKPRAAPVDVRSPAEDDPDAALLTCIGNVVGERTLGLPAAPCIASSRSTATSFQISGSSAPFPPTKRRL